MRRIIQSSVLVRISLLIGVILIDSGCGSNHPPTFAAGGQVRFTDGKPLSGGFVVLRPLGMEPALNARGFIQRDGTFRLGTFGLEDGAIEGDHQVLITPPGFVGNPDELLAKGQSLPVIVAAKYQAFDTSGFQCTVTREPSTNQYVFVLDRPKS